MEDPTPPEEVDEEPRRRATDPLVVDEEYAQGIIEKHPIIFPTAIATLIALVVCLVTVAITSHRQSDTIDNAAKAAASSVQLVQRESQVNACDSGSNITKATALALSKNDPLVKAYLPILDCEKTYMKQRGKPAPLSPGLQDCYLRLYSTRVFQRIEPTSNPRALEQLCAEFGGPTS